MDVRIKETGQMLNLVHRDVQPNGEDFTADVLDVMYDKSVEYDTEDEMYVMTLAQFEEYEEDLMKEEEDVPEED